MKRVTVALAAVLLGGARISAQAEDVFGGVLDGPAMQGGAGVSASSAPGSDYVARAARIPCPIMAEIFFNVGSTTYGSGTADDERRARRGGRGRPTFPETAPASIPAEAWNQAVFDAFAKRAMECSAQGQRGLDFATTTNRLRWMAISVKAAEKKRQDDEQLRQYRQEEAASQRAGLVVALDAQVADADAQQSSTALSPRIDAIERGLADPGIPDDARARLTPRIELLHAKLSKLRAEEIAALERDRAAREARAAQDNEELGRLENANRERANALADERARRANHDEERRMARHLEAGQNPSPPARNEAVARVDRQETTEEMMDRISGRSPASRRAPTQSQGTARPGLDTGLLREICPPFAAGYPSYKQTERRLGEEGRRSSSFLPSEKASNRTDFCRPYATKMGLFQAMRRDLASCVRPGADPAIGSGLARLDDSIAGWSQTTASAGCAN